MKYTPNLNLKKPDLTDSILISDINENMDTIDAEISGLKEGTASIPDLEKVDKTLAGAINEVKNDVGTVKKEMDNHLIEQMPHRFLDNGVWYRWGFRTMNGKPQFIYEEVKE